MALIEGRDMFSSIRNSARFSLLMPEGGAKAARAVMYLLPVRRGLATDWVRYTEIEMLARERKIAVVMPEGIGSDFCNMVYGMKWWDYLTEELPEYLKRVFALPPGTLCFGAEMGGLGSLKLALRRPEQFIAAGAAGTDFLRVSRYAAGETADPDLESVYGPLPVAEERLEQSDPLRLAVRRGQPKSALFLCPEDEGVREVAERYGEGVHWLQTRGTGWKKYGACLEEFLNAAL